MRDAEVAYCFTSRVYSCWLTSREREVTRLVAQCKSNHAITNELVGRVSTVEAHVISSTCSPNSGLSSRAHIAS
jgi:ATP/maltotriose-dependent transcriptional regulator MalT